VELDLTRVTRFDVTVISTSEHNEVTHMIDTNDKVINHKVGLLNLAEELSYIKSTNQSGDIALYRVNFDIA